MEQQFRSFLRTNSSFFGSTLKLGLAGLSKLFQGVVFLRNQAYDKNLLKSGRPAGTYIISIGNLQAGGSGKTPFTIFLAKSLSGSKSAILTRGYRAKKKQKHSFIIDAKTPIDIAYTGDEPALLAQNLPENAVVIGKNRQESAQLAFSRGYKLLLLDDGFQHRALQRDTDIVLIDASTHPEEMHPFPRGILRENPKALSRADLVVITRAKDIQDYTTLKQRYSSYTKAPFVGVELTVGGILGDYATLNQSLFHKKGALFCGIANPKSFVETVETLHIDIVARHFFDDHADYSLSQLYTITTDAKAKGAEFLICTEKDAVKISSWTIELPLPVVWPHMEMKVAFDKDAWEAWLSGLKKKVNECI
ncbi:MAG: tetraacyldisaccharide 4'-kinase [Parachlamydiales bacterium]|jgi:tetraacyldisaccharide 4'-kinase